MRKMTVAKRLVAVASISLASALSVASVAAAQEQTQESAVRFLNLFASQNQLSIGLSTRFDQLDPAQRLQLRMPNVRLVGASIVDADEPCITDLKMSDGKDGYLDWTKSEVYFWPRSSWSEALLASDYGPLVKPMIEVRRLDKSFSDIFWPSDEGQGARIFKAMRFLRDSCDPMKATGF